MKITDVTTTLMTVPIAGIRWSGGQATAIPATLITISTDEGLTGLGDVYCGALAPGVVVALVDHFNTQLVGQDPTNVEAAWRLMYGRSLFWGRNGIAASVMSGIENACWDIAGKAAGLPVYKLLGGRVHDRLPIYASGGLDSETEQFAAEMTGYREQGFRAVKVRIGHGPDADRERVRLAREILGWNIEIMIDAVQGHHPEPWNATMAKRVARAIEEYNVSWFEEPCAATDVKGYREVRASTTIPIAGGESCTSLQEIAAFLDNDALDVIQPDVTHCGGILACKRVATLAASRSVEIVPHSWGTGAMLSATYHFAFSTPGCRMIEFPTWGYPLRDELLASPFDICDGYLYLSDAPGLGIELRDEIVTKYKYQPGILPEMRSASGRS